MNLKDINKKYILGFIVLALAVLIVITAIQPGSVRYQNTTDYEQLEAKAEIERVQYEKLLADIKPDYAESEQFLKKVINEDVVRLQLETDLNNNRKITLPVIRDSEIKIVDRKDADAVANYLTDLSSMVVNYNDKINPLMPQLFPMEPDVSAPTIAQKETNELVNNIRSMSVPVDAVPIHKSTLIAYQEFAQLMGSATTYAQDPETAPWKNVYEQYFIIDSSMVQFKQQLLDLTKQYALEDSNIGFNSNPFIKSAQAGWPVIDIWQVVWESYKGVLSQAFAQYYIKLTNSLMTSVEKNFSIASQLYYTNALGRHYSVEYFKKFVPDPLDQEIISQFLPDYFCKPKDPEFLHQVYIAKAKLNAAPNLVFDPKDPMFLEKMAKLISDPMNDPINVEDFYNTLVAITKGQAEMSAFKEVSSDGLKAGRAPSANSDIIGKTIQKTTSKTRDVQSAIFNNILGLGSGNPDNIIGPLITAAITTITQKYVFTPLGGGDLEVYQETEKCLKIPKIKPIVPIEDPGYSNPAKPGMPTTVPLPPTAPNSFR